MTTLYIICDWSVLLRCSPEACISVSADLSKIMAQFFKLYIYYRYVSGVICNSFCEMEVTRRAMINVW